MNERPALVSESHKATNKKLAGIHMFSLAHFIPISTVPLNAIYSSSLSREDFIWHQILCLGCNGTELDILFSLYNPPLPEDTLTGKLSLQAPRSSMKIFLFISFFHSFFLQEGCRNFSIIAGKELQLPVDSDLWRPCTDFLTSEMYFSGEHEGSTTSVSSYSHSKGNMSLM